ncbi:MAG TPA: DUF4339 domain-containing protein [Planctomycetota bacterium]|nr:DUF4339 domain-containing protein [Planctomycetota bacterium]
METKRWWIVGHDDKAWGPFEKAPLAVLAAEGKLRADRLVCGEGETRWSPIENVPELSEISRAPLGSPAAQAPGTSPILPPLAPVVRSSEAPLRLNELDPIPGWATVLLSIPTLGLWGGFNFYRTMRVYRRLAGNTTSNVETLFWVMISVVVLGVITLPVVVGWVLLVAAIVVGALLVRETLRLRDLAVLRLVPQAATQPSLYPVVKSDDWHFGLWITGALLTLTVALAIVGVPILIAQALAWFEDWNRIAALARAPVSAPAPAPSQLAQPA